MPPALIALNDFIKNRRKPALTLFLLFSFNLLPQLAALSEICKGQGTSAPSLSFLSSPLALRQTFAFPLDFGASFFV